MKLTTLRIHIDVNLIPSDDLDVAASIDPVSNELGEIIDTKAFDDFLEFAINVTSVLDRNGFELIESETSNKSETSFYYTAYKRNESTGDNIKCLIFLRISDHGLRSEAERARNNYYAKKAESLKQPKSKKHQTWKFKNLTINNTRFNSYNEAERALDDWLSHL